MKRSKSGKRELEEEIALLGNVSFLSRSVGRRRHNNSRRTEKTIKQRIEGKPSASIRDIEE